MFLILIFSPIIIFGACPAMTGSKNYKKEYYYVNQERFDSYAKAKNFIRSLKKQEDGWKKLEVSKQSSYRYATSWIYPNKDHGYFCVCPDCRFNEKKNTSTRKVSYNQLAFSFRK